MGVDEDGHKRGLGTVLALEASQDLAYFSSLSISILATHPLCVSAAMANADFSKSDYADRSRLLMGVAQKLRDIGYIRSMFYPGILEIDENLLPPVLKLSLTYLELLLLVNSQQGKGK